jgi:glutathione S-transferase
VTPARLVTIGISHFCEKARWALEWTGTPFVEEAHAPGMHVIPARRAGGRTTPILLLDGAVLRDSTDILVALDARATPEKKLYPADTALRREAMALEDTFDEKLGPAVRRAMYHVLLPHRGPAIDAMAARASPMEKAALRVTFPVLRALMRRSMRIDAEGAARSREVIDRVFADVEDRLARGARYLVGDRFSAADLTFASLAAPALLVKEYGAPIPGIEASPAEVAELVTRLRKTAAGAFAARIYAEHRARG